MSAAGPPQGTRPLGGAAQSADRGGHTSAAESPQGANGASPPDSAGAPAENAGAHPSRGGRFHLPGDWFARGIPAPVRLGADVYLDSSYGFDAVLSEVDPAVVLGDACGAYDRAAFIVGPTGRIDVGAYTVLNGCYLLCESQITIGAHCLFAWGSVVTDHWGGLATLDERREALRRAAANRERWVAQPVPSRPVTIADNVWIGFDAVVMPGVTIGRGAVVSSRSVIVDDVPAYAVVVGNPGRIVRFLEPDDDAASVESALRTRVRSKVPPAVRSP